MSARGLGGALGGPGRLSRAVSATSVKLRTKSHRQIANCPPSWGREGEEGRKAGFSSGSYHGGAPAVGAEARDGGRGPRACLDEEGGDEEEEVAVVVPADARVEPFAVVVEAADALVAHAAVLRRRAHLRGRWVKLSGGLLHAGP